MSRSYLLSELAELLGARLVGDGQVRVGGVAGLEEAGPGDLSFLHNPRYLAQARASRAAAVLVAQPELLPDRNLLVTPQPYLALARALELFHPVHRPAAGVHPTAAVADDVRIGSEASVGACAVVGSGCRVGDRTVIGGGCVLGREVEVGQDCLLHPRVVVEDRCRIGDRCILHAGVVIGSDGFGFATVGGVHHKVPQVGIVVLEDDVELGANTCVDRATIGETRVGRGTKVDNLVQIAHNVQIGEGSLMAAQVGIAGSVTIGHHVTFAGQSGSAGHLRIGDNVVVTGRAGVMKDLPAGAMVSGMPARPLQEWLRANANLHRLDALRRQLAGLEARLRRLEGSLSGDEP